jgi:hypothetical protein
MDALKIVGYSSLAGVLALLLIGCGGPSGVDAAPAQSSPAAGFSASPPVEGTDSNTASGPPAEGSGPEAPQRGGTSRPSIPVASLPIGGDDVKLPDRAPGCASAAWLGDDLPSGVSVSVTAVVIKPAVFVTSSECGGHEPLCLGSFAFTANQRSCDIPVAATGEPDTEAELTLTGKARCPAGQPAFCVRLGEAGKNADGRSIILRAPSDGSPTDVPTPEETPPTDDRSPGSTG